MGSRGTYSVLQLKAGGLVYQINTPCLTGAGSEISEESINRNESRDALKYDNINFHDSGTGTRNS